MSFRCSSELMVSSSATYTRQARLRPYRSTSGPVNVPSRPAAKKPVKKSVPTLTALFDSWYLV